MADIFANNILNKVINNIIKNKTKVSDERAWFNLTRNMFYNYPAIEVFNLVYLALQEASDENWFENKYPKSIFQDLDKKRKVQFTKSAIKNIINKKIKITDVAKRYGLNIEQDKKTVCPFHNDGKASCFFDNDRNIFHCFGCGAKGDTITFIKKMEELGYAKKRS